MHPTKVKGMHHYPPRTVWCSMQVTPGVVIVGNEHCVIVAEVVRPYPSSSPTGCPRCRCSLRLADSEREIGINVPCALVSVSGMKMSGRGPSSMTGDLGSVGVPFMSYCKAHLRMGIGFGRHG